MKKLIIVGLMFVSGALYASCVGPYCYNDTGAQVPTSTGPMGLNSKTTAQLGTLIPSAAGQLVYCSDCGSSGFHRVCVSSGTGPGAWIEVAAASGTVRCQ